MGFSEQTNGNGNGLGDFAGQVMDNLENMGEQISGSVQPTQPVVVNYRLLGQEVKKVRRTLSDTEKATYSMQGAEAHNDLETLYEQREAVLRQKNQEIAAIDAQIMEKENAMREACRIAVAGSKVEEVECDFYIRGNDKIWVQKGKDPSVSSNIIWQTTVQTDEIQPEQEMI